jgi:hypothetical protein
MVIEEGSLWGQLGTLETPGDWERKCKINGIRYGIRPANFTISKKISAHLLGYNAV